MLHKTFVVVSALNIRYKTAMAFLHCALSLAAQCIVIGPVCGGRLRVCVLVGLLPRQLELACIDLHQTGFVGKGSDHLQLIKFWPSRAPGEGSAAGRKFLGPSYYSQRAVFASLSAFFIVYALTE